MNEKYFVRIAPLVRLPIARTQVFSYFSREPIKIGSLVDIPFYNRLIEGIVIECQSDFPREGNFEIKPVKKVSAEEFLSEKQIELAKTISDFYISPLGIVLKSMVPKMSSRRKLQKAVSKLTKIENKNQTAKEILLTKEKEIALTGRKKERDRAVFSLMKKTLQKKKQFLYLAPEIFSAVAFFENLKKYFPARKIALIHGSVSRGEIFDAWSRIKEGGSRIVVATKIGVFLPFSGLGTIVAEESGDISHKQWDMNPRYNAVAVARMLGKIHGAKIIFSNAAPSLDIWRGKKEKDIKVIETGADGAKLPKIKIANIFEEKNSADFPLGKELRQALESIIGRKEKALLVVNRRGFSSYSICRACKQVLRCPNCERALVYFEEKEQYSCLHCSHKADLLSACGACGACQFSHQGIGIQLVEKKVKRLFPSARVLRLDADVSKSRKGMKKILGHLTEGSFDILIGTQIALKIGSLQEFGLVAFPSFDDLGSIPDFNTRESSFAMLCQARSFAGNNASIIIQTTRPNDFLPVSFQKGNVAEFFEKELEERKKTNTPPFSRLVKIFYRAKDKKTAKDEALKTLHLLQAVSDSNIDISGPYEPFAAKKRGYYYENLLIKANPDADSRKISIFPVLGGLKKNWAVDIDPISTV